MQVPASALSAEDLAEFVGEGEPVPEYIDIVGEVSRAAMRVGECTLHYCGWCGVWGAQW